MNNTMTTHKTDTIDRLNDEYSLNLSDDEFERLRNMTKSELSLLDVLLCRAVKSAVAAIE